MANNQATGFSHEKIETNNFLMILLILLVVAVGGIVEIVPLFFQKSTTEAAPGLKPGLHAVRAEDPREGNGGVEGVLDPDNGQGPRLADAGVAGRREDGNTVRARPLIRVKDSKFLAQPRTIGGTLL